ncbi:MAG: hypothetical protein AB7G17_12465 [Phycisphaerales bacterium]
MERDPHESNPESPELYVGPHADELEDLDGDTKPAWPKVIGIISIVWGSLGLVCNGAGIGWQLMAGSFVGNMPGGAPPALTNPSPLGLGLGAMSIIWSIVLIVAGAMTVGRKPVGRTAHLVWAAGAVALTVLGIFLQLKVQGQIDQWCIDNPDAEFAKQQAMSGPIGKYMGIGCIVFFGFGWPLFSFIWFGLVKRKPSDITQGVTDIVA